MGVVSLTTHGRNERTLGEPGKDWEKPSLKTIRLPPNNERKTTEPKDLTPHALRGV